MGETRYLFLADNLTSLLVHCLGWGRVYYSSNLQFLKKAASFLGSVSSLPGPRVWVV